MRPRKCRFIRHAPASRLFKPQGIPAHEVEILTLKNEELEALRLADALEHEHEEAASLMNVSRPTFSRILTSARRTVATALTESRAIEIGGGDNRFIVPHEDPPHTQEGDKTMPNYDGTGPMGRGRGGCGRGQGNGRGFRNRGQDQGRGLGPCGRGRMGATDETSKLEILIAQEETRLQEMKDRLAALRA